MITTSYYYMLSHIQRPISIALKAPQWYRGKVYKKLAPSFTLLREYRTGIIQADEFKFRYEQSILAPLDPYEVLNELYELVNLPKTSEENFSLLSYERPEVVSHRRFVAEWLNTILPDDKQIKEFRATDCQIDKFAVKNIALYRDQIPEMRY